MKHTILCIDDEIDNVEALERLFRKKYRVLKATSGPEALVLLANEPNISLIISDQRMPEMTGVELLEKSLLSHPTAIRILLTGFTDIESVISAINSGQIYRYVTKPWDPIDLTTAVDRAIEKYELTEELKSKNHALEKALMELSTLDKAKDQFMILINHELKTPLTSILSFSELLKETSLDEEQQKFLNRIQVGADRLREIIDDVLKLISAETGLLTIKQSLVDTRSLGAHFSSKTLSSIHNKNQTLQFNLTDINLILDKNIISEVLDRLIHNASKFGNPNSIIICRSEKIENDQTKIIIENEGSPIPASIIEKIMKPFVLNEDIMKHSTGMGLGLSLTQALLKTHNSTLKFECHNNKVQVYFVI